MIARTLHPLLAASAGLLLLSGAALAQTPPTTPPAAPAAPQAGAPGALGAETPDEAMPSPAENCTVDPGNAEAGTTSDSQMLTDQLDDCESVLMPQTDGDPEMAAPVPDADPGTTPVIPPGTIAPQAPKSPN